MTPEEQRRLEEEQIRNDFSALQQELSGLENEISDENESKTFSEFTKQLNGLQEQINQISENTDLGTLRSELARIRQDIDEFKQSIHGEAVDLQEQIRESVDKQNEKIPTPSTYELLKDSATVRGIEGDPKHPGLLKIIESNPNEFKNLPGDTAEKKLEYIFEKIRNSIVLFMKNKLGDSENTKKVIDNTIAPAFERSLMEMLRDQGNDANIGMLQGIDGISWEGNIFFNGFKRLLNGVSDFSKKATGSYNKFSQWMNAIDYLSVHNGVLSNPEKSEVLTSPIEFKEYMSKSEFSRSDFSPYTLIDGNIFKISDENAFEFGISKLQQESVLSEIGNIKVENNPKTTSLIAGMLDKPEKFLLATSGLQERANGLLNGLNALNPITKIFGTDIMSEISKSLEKKGIAFRIFDFVCKLIGITGGVEGIINRWRLNRINLTDEKNKNINQIFSKYKELAGENVKLTITDENSCKTALADFAVTNPQNDSTTKGDFLRDSIVENMDISLISPSVVQQTLGSSYLKKETIQENGKTKERFIVDESKITKANKITLAQNHLINMKAHLEVYKNDAQKIDLTEFYKKIDSTEDIALCITASLYADKNDVIEGVKANVFLPENYGIVRLEGASEDNNTNSGRENLDSAESSDKEVVTEQWVYDKAVEYGITDNRQIAYVLSTIKGESNFKNQKEIGGENRDYGKIDSTTGKAYYGRGFIQLTHKSNYQKYTQIIKDMGKDFVDNDGNVLRVSDIDLVNNPDIILKSNELSIFIAIHGMKNGNFTGKKLDDFINNTQTDFYSARSIVNGMSSRPGYYADNVQSYLDKLGVSGTAIA